MVTLDTMITLRTLGECVVEVDGEPLGPDADTTFAVLVLLAAERDRALSRRHVAELFWPGVGESRARHALRQLLYRLRAFGVELDAGREHIRLPAEVIAPTFAAEPTLERLREAQAAGTLVVGPYLPGYAPTFSPAYGEWLDAQRSIVETQVRRALLQAAQEHQIRGEWAAADALAREVLRIDPLNEDATIKRAECAAMMGGKAEALAILDRYNAEMGERGVSVTLPAAVLRKRIAEQLPVRRYAIPSDRCFVGRESTTAMLTVALLRAKNKEGSALLLWGPPGIGKTRIAQELTGVAVVQGLRLVRVQCEESDARQPMSAWVDAVPQLLRLPGALGVSPDAMPFLKRLTEFDPTQREPSPEARDPQYLAGRIRQSIVDLVDAVAGEGPLFLLFEDVHWMDGASWAALRLLLEWNASKPVLILMTSRRPHATPAPPQREEPRLELHEVAALEAPAAAKLVRAVEKDFGGPLPEGAEAWCLGVGEGNPLYLRELVVDCLVEGKPRPVPPTVQTLLDARIARLRPGARQVLQASAILGEHSTVERLDAVLGMATYELVGALDELGEAGLVATEGALIRPRHEVVAARIAAVTSEGSKQLLHRRSATVLESDIRGETPLDLMWACARHWQAVGKAERGLQLALSAAAQLIEVGSPRDAIGVCEEADGFCTTEEDGFAVTRVLAHAQGLDGQWHRAAMILSELVNREQGCVPTDRWAQDAIAAVTADARGHGLHPKHLDALRPIAADPQLDPSIRIEAGLFCLVISSNLWDTEAARATWKSLQDLPSLSNERDLLALRAVMTYHITFGEMFVGAHATGKLLKWLSDIAPLPSQIALLINVGDACHAIGRTEDAVRAHSQAFSMSARQGMPFLAVRSADKLACLALEIQDPVRAEAWLAEAMERLSGCQDATTNHEIGDSIARLMLLKGDVVDAAVRAAANYNSAALVGDLALISRRSYLTTLAECRLACEDGPIEHAVLEPLRAVHAKMQDCVFHDRTARVLYRILRRQGAHDAAEELAADYLRVRRGGPISPTEFFPGTSG